jgi:predicted trehalose synthase
MATARRVSLFEREVRVRLAPAGLDVLFDEARVLTEGQVDGARYYGSTMMTIDLARVQEKVSDECDAALARRVAELAAADERVRERARKLAVGAAERLHGDLDAPTIDVHVHRDGRVVHLDLDVEARRKA